MILPASVTLCVCVSCCANTAVLVLILVLVLLLHHDTGLCTATIDTASCFWLETNLAVTVNEDLNPLYAAYKAYSTIQSGMMNDTYVNEMDAVEKLTYLTPAVPVGVERVQPLNSLESSAESGRKRHSRWILASGLTLLGVGSIALAAVVSKNHLEKSKGKRNAGMLQADLLTETRSLAVPSGDVPLA